MELWVEGSSQGRHPNSPSEVGSWIIYSCSGPMTRRNKVGGTSEVGIGSEEEANLGLGLQISPGLKETTVGLM